MANYQYKDKTIEIKLEDGSVAYTRVSIILNALNFYRNKCLEIISKGSCQPTDPFKITYITSYEDLINHLNKDKNKELKVAKAQNLLSKIDRAIKTIIENNQPDKPKSNNEFGK